MLICLCALHSSPLYCPAGKPELLQSKPMPPSAIGLHSFIRSFTGSFICSFIQLFMKMFEVMYWPSGKPELLQSKHMPPSAIWPAGRSEKLSAIWPAGQMVELFHMCLQAKWQKASSSHLSPALCLLSFCSIAHNTALLVYTPRNSVDTQAQSAASSSQCPFGA